MPAYLLPTCCVGRPSSSVATAQSGLALTLPVPSSFSATHSPPLLKSPSVSVPAWLSAVWGWEHQKGGGGHRTRPSTPSRSAAEAPSLMTKPISFISSCWLFQAGGRYIHVGLVSQSWQVDNGLIPPKRVEPLDFAGEWLTFQKVREARCWCVKWDLTKSLHRWLKTTLEPVGQCLILSRRKKSLHFLRDTGGKAKQSVSQISSWTSTDFPPAAVLVLTAKLDHPQVL